MNTDALQWMAVSRWVYAIHPTSDKPSDRAFVAECRSKQQAESIVEDHNWSRQCPHFSPKPDAVPEPSEEKPVHGFATRASVAQLEKRMDELAKTMSELCGKANMASARLNDNRGQLDRHTRRMDVQDDKIGEHAKRLNAHCDRLDGHAYRLGEMEAAQ